MKERITSNRMELLMLLFLLIVCRISDARIGETIRALNDEIMQLQVNLSSSELVQIYTIDSSIVGGYQVDSPERYPYIVSIMEVDLFSKRGIHQCAGSLIAPDIVLTAAHCVDYSAIRVVDTGRFSWKDDTNVEVFHVMDIYTHPDFNGDFFLNDVALLKLGGKASFVTDFAHLVDDRTLIGIDQVITPIGWGLTSDGGAPSPNLRAVDVKIISKFECQKYYGEYITDTMICAYGFSKDACQGDSGGPALHTDSSGHTYQVGIISWGDSCGKNPGVYTNLQSPTIMNFINKRMCETLVPEKCNDGYFYGNTAINDSDTVSGGDTNIGMNEETASYSYTSTEAPENKGEETNVPETLVTDETNDTVKINLTNTNATSTTITESESEISQIELNETASEIFKTNETKTKEENTNVNETKVTENTIKVDVGDVASQEVNVDLCKNTDVAYCDVIKNMPWFGCKFSNKKCPEICCKSSCDPQIGCI